jgi:hypothetical protein
MFVLFLDRRGGVMIVASNRRVFYINKERISFVEIDKAVETIFIFFIEHENPLVFQLERDESDSPLDLNKKEYELLIQELRFHIGRHRP